MSKKSTCKIRIYLMGILFLILFVGFGPFFTPYDPLELNLDAIWLSPCREHLMGTDQLGRDILTRLMYGGRLSLWIALIVEVITLPIGTFLGYLGGINRRLVWEPVNQMIDILFAFPTIILALFIGGFLGRGAKTIVITICIVEIPVYYIYVQRQVRQIMQMQFIRNLRLLGVSEGDIFLHHVTLHLIPLLMPRLIVNFATTIVFEATLSFLGMGIQVPDPSWGNMISEGIEQVKVHPHLVLFSSLMLALTTLFLFGLGESLQEKSTQGGSR